jgi:hypothetical protein
VLFLQRLSRPIENRLKRGWVLHRKIGQSFSVNRDVGSSQPLYEPAIGRSLVAASCINSLNPQIAKISLPRFSVPVGPILGLPGRVFSVPEKFGAPSPVAFGFIQGSFTAFSTSWSVGCSRHSLSPGFRAPHRQAVVIVNCPPTSPVSLRNSFGRWATAPAAVSLGAARLSFAVKQKEDSL